MAVKYGFFNSVNGDRKYNAEDMTKYFDKIVSDGVFHDTETALQVSPLSGMTIQMHSGRGFISCHWLENNASYSLNVSQSHVTLDRKDRVVMRLNMNENARNMEIKILTGTFSSIPKVPPISSDPLITDLTLAYIDIPHGTTEITESNIIDKRNDAAECGWVRSLIASAGGDIKKYQSHRALEAETKTFTVNIAEYRTIGTVLQIYVNGIMLIENVEYTVSGSGASAIVTLTNTIRAGNAITCIVLSAE